MTDTENASYLKNGSKEILEAMPHLSRLGVTDDTPCQVFREYNYRQDCVEYTLYLRPEGQPKWRIDAFILSNTLAAMSDDEISDGFTVMNNWTVTYMGPAVTAHFTAEDEACLNAIRHGRLAELLDKQPLV